MSRRPGLPAEQRLGLIAWAALITLQPVWHAWLFPPTVMPTWLVLLVTTVPLLLPLLAIRDVRRALLWVGLLSLFYFSHGVAEAWSAAGQRGLALLEVVLTVLLIALLGAGVKRRPNSAKSSSRRARGDPGAARPPPSIHVSPRRQAAIAGDQRG